MAKVRLLNGKPLIVGGKVALSDDCCCVTSEGCTCPLPDEDCPHSLAISIKFDDTDTDESHFILFTDSGETEGIYGQAYDNGDGTHIIEVGAWGSGGFVDFAIEDDLFFNVYHNICAKINRFDDNTVNIAVTVDSSSGSFTMDAPSEAIGLLQVGAKYDGGEAHRTIQCVTLLSNPDSAEEDFLFPTESFSLLVGGASIVGGLLRIDGSGDSYAVKGFSTGYDLLCGKCAGFTTLSADFSFNASDGLYSFLGSGSASGMLTDSCECLATTTISVMVTGPGGCIQTRAVTCNAHVSYLGGGSWEFDCDVTMDDHQTICDGSIGWPDSSIVAVFSGSFTGSTTSADLIPTTVIIMNAHCDVTLS